MHTQNAERVRKTQNAYAKRRTRTQNAYAEHGTRKQKTLKPQKVQKIAKNHKETTGPTTGPQSSLV